MKTEVIQVRVKPALFAQIKREAENHQCTVSELVRKVLEEALTPVKQQKETRAA